MLGFLESKRKAPGCMNVTSAPLPRRMLGEEGERSRFSTEFPPDSRRLGAILQSCDAVVFPKTPYFFLNPRLADRFGLRAEISFDESVFYLLEDLTMRKGVVYFIENQDVGENPSTSQGPDGLAGKHEDLESTGKEQVAPSHIRAEQLSTSDQALSKRICSEGDKVDETKNKKASIAPYKKLFLVKQLPVPVKQEPVIYGKKQAAFKKNIAEQLSSSDSGANQLPCSENDKLDDTQNKETSIAPSRNILSVNEPIKQPQTAGDDQLKSSEMCSIPVQEHVVLNENDKTSITEHSSLPNPETNKVASSESVQDGDVSVKPPKTKREKKACPVCNKVLSSQSNLNRHILTRHPDEPGIQGMISTPAKKSSYICRICEKEFNFLPHLKYHEKSVHNLVSDTKNRKTGKPVADVQVPVVINQSGAEQLSSSDPKANSLPSSEIDKLGGTENKNNTSIVPSKNILLLISSAVTQNPAGSGKESVVINQSGTEQLSSCDPKANSLQILSSEIGKLGDAKSKSNSIGPSKKCLILVNSAVTQKPAGDGQVPVVINQSGTEQLSSCDPKANILPSSEIGELGDAKNKNNSIVPSKNILLLVRSAVNPQQPAGDAGLKGDEKCSIPDLVVHNESDKTSAECSSSSNPVANNVPCSGGDSNKSETDKNAVGKQVFLIVKKPGTRTPVCLQAVKQHTENSEKCSDQISVPNESGNPPSAGNATSCPTSQGVTNGEQSDQNALNNPIIQVFQVVNSPSIGQNASPAICSQKGNQVAVSFSGKHRCPLCKKKFPYAFSMKRHIRKIHAGEPGIPNLTKTYKYPCSVCHRRYNSSRSLRYHEKKVHSTEPVLKKSPLHTCPVCFNNFEKTKLPKHLITDHEIPLKEEHFSCKTYEEFLSWKSNIERETKSYFIKRCSRKKNYKMYEYYSCHRSGKFVSSSKGKRKLKRQGSKKINALCPASLKITKDYVGDFVITYQSVHLGHSEEIQHMPLQPEEKQYLASKLRANFSLKDILEDIRRNFPLEKHKRLHLLNRKDLHNIRKSYGITTPLVTTPRTRKSTSTRSSKVRPSTRTHARVQPSAQQASDQSTDGSDNCQVYEDPDPWGTEYVYETENPIQEEPPLMAPESSASMERKQRLKETFARFVDSATSYELEFLENGVLSLGSQLTIFRQDISDAVSGIVEIGSAPVPEQKRETVLKKRGVRCRTSPVKKKVKKTSFYDP